MGRPGRWFALAWRNSGVPSGCYGGATVPAHTEGWRACFAASLTGSIGATGVLVSVTQYDPGAINILIIEDPQFEPRSGWRHFSCSTSDILVPITDRYAFTLKEVPGVLNQYPVLVCVNQLHGLSITPRGARQEQVPAKVGTEGHT